MRRKSAALTHFFSTVIAGLVLLNFTYGIRLGANEAGWRGDGSGLFPNATPVTSWSSDKNVVWKTEMPSWSNSSPVISGERLFVCSEPFTLLCLNLSDGKILWVKSEHSVIDVAPADQQEALRAKVKTYKEKKQQHDTAFKCWSDLRTKKNAAPADEHAKLDAEIAAQDAIWKPLKAEVEALRAEVGLPTAYESTGYSTATPVTDGKLVSASFGNGVCAVYDLEGNLKWARLVQRPKDDQEGGHSSSPVIVGDKLIVHFGKVFGLKLETGETLWEADAKSTFGSLTKVKLGELDAVLTASGVLINAKDGAVLLNELGELEGSTYVANGNVIYAAQFKRPGALALELSVGPDGKVVSKELMSGKADRGTYFASPLVHDGLIYTVNDKGGMSVIDATSGALVYKQKLDHLQLGDFKLDGLKPEPAKCYSSVTMAGGYIFLSSDVGNSVIVKPGRTYEEVAKNTLDLFRSCPVFSGKRMYVRTASHVYCIGE